MQGALAYVLTLYTTYVLLMVSRIPLKGLRAHILLTLDFKGLAFMGFMVQGAGLDFESLLRCSVVVAFGMFGHSLRRRWSCWLATPGAVITASHAHHAQDGHHHRT